MEKLIAEYQKKIAQYDAQIDFLTKKIRDRRQDKKRYLASTTESIKKILNEEEDCWRNYRKIVDAKRMLLVQVIKDLENYL